MHTGQQEDKGTGQIPWLPLWLENPVIKMQSGDTKAYLSQGLIPIPCCPHTS